MSPISRGFRRKREEAPAGRVPPGQYVTRDFPVLSAGPTPHTALSRWSFSITGGRETKSWTWDEFRALPTETLTTDIHCVTRWSKLDTDWEGVPIQAILELARLKPSAITPPAWAGCCLRSCSVNSSPTPRWPDCGAIRDR